MIICADTIVTIPCESSWKILEKPTDKTHAQEMIKNLSGKFHFVITGVSIVLPKNNNEIISFSETTKVFFANLDDKEIEAYSNTDEP